MPTRLPHAAPTDRPQLTRPAQDASMHMRRTAGHQSRGEVDEAAPALEGDLQVEAYADAGDLDVDLIDWRVGAACSSTT